MSTILVNPNQSMPVAHESSALRSARDSDDMHRQWRRANVSNAQLQSMQVSINQLARKVEMMRRRILGGAGGVQELWQTPRELDPTVAVDQYTLVYISPENDLVTTGLVDLVSTDLTTASAGIWMSMQDVPATDGTNYNVPQLPYPGATGTPAGSPLEGDLDGDNVFWALITPTCW